MILWQGPRRLGHAANGFAHGVEGAFRKARAVQVGAHEQVSQCRHFLVPFSRSTTGFASARGRPHRHPTGDATGPSRHSLKRPPISPWNVRSEEHTSELQSLKRISYAT